MKAELRVVEWQNEIMVESPFSQLCGTPPPSEKSQQLRERHKLDDVIAGSTSDFDSMLRLKEWVHTRWRHGWHHPAGPVDAMLALAAAEEGFDMNCGYFALTLLECLQALGFVARSANASKTATEWKDDVEGNTGHSIIEVWSDDLCKWVMLDADLNVHYESEDGVPLSVLGIHDEWMAGPAAWDKVKQVQGATPYCMTDLGGKSMPSPDFYGEDFVFDPEAEGWVFNRHRVGDYFVHCSWALADGRKLNWVDSLTPPRLMVSSQPVLGRQAFAAAEPVAGADTVWVSSRDQAEWSVNQVHIELTIGDDADGEHTTHAQPQGAEGAEHSDLRCRLHSNMPNMSELLIKFDNGPWETFQPHEIDSADGSAYLPWRLVPGKNVVMAKCVNAYGREGRTSRVLLRYHPATADVVAPARL
jgi:hypothetical protein